MIALPIAAVVAVPVVSSSEKANEVQAFQVPGGRWKNGLCSCCSGSTACPCPCLMGWCCFPILLGQVVERLKYATRGDGTSWPICWMFAILFMIALIIEIVLLATNDYSAAQATDYFTADNIYLASPLYNQILVWVLAAWVWFIFIVSCCTRMKMRKQYQIEPLCLGDNCCDDCCVTWYVQY